MRVPLLIVGGGIGGMTSALALAQAGFPVHVVEQAVEFGEIGAGIQLAPNATRILHRMDLLEAVDAVSVHPRNLVFMHTGTGRRLGTVEFGRRFRDRYGQAYTVLHRGDLLDILLAACRDHDLITLETDSPVVDVLELGDEAEVNFAGGGSYRCAAVVGADGLWSRVRELISDDRPVCSGYVAYRGALPVGEVTGPVEPDDEIIWIGPHHHLVQYPIRRGELYNQVAVFRSCRYHPDVAATDDWGTPEELDEHFADSCAEVRAAVGLLGRQRRWPTYDRAPIGNWTRGRVTLLGDAAHPMLQYLAQGACQAIEDADSLARHLVKHGGDVVEAFASYQAERIPRTAQIQRVARIWGEVWHDDGPIVPALRDRVFGRTSAEHYTDLDWLYQPDAS